MKSNVHIKFVSRIKQWNVNYSEDSKGKIFTKQEFFGEEPAARKRYFEILDEIKRQ
jgi:hypothetical protein